MTQMLPFRPQATTTRSERLVFDFIARDQTLKDHTALHSLGLARHSRKSYAECDFVIIGPSGIFCLEVKGGSVSRHEGIWTIGWPGYQYTSEEGPFKQAQSARGALLDEIRSRCGGEILRRVPVGWGVIFPDIKFDQQDPEWDLDCVFDERDREAPFSTYLNRLAQYTRLHELNRGRQYPENISCADINIILRTFRSDFDLVPRISGLLRDSRDELLALTTEQYSHLAAITHSANPRVICEGSAGTGKTLLAAECARRLANSGVRVLFLCFNRNLAWHLRHQDMASDSRITIDTIGRFLYDLTNKGTSQHRSLHSDVASLAKFAEDAVVSAIDRGTFEPFDVIVIDEAQDVLNTPVIDVLDWCVQDGVTNGRWALFLDTGIQASIYSQLNTKLYDKLSRLSLNLPLTVNMRNPRAVAAEASAFADMPAPPCRRNVLTSVDYRIVKETRSVNRVATALLTELKAEGATSADIALLSFHSPQEAFFADGFTKIGLKVQTLDGYQDAVTEDCVFAASIPSFKGLEAEIVVVGDVPYDEPSTWHLANLYVALTRARTKAYILCPESFVNYRMELIGRMAGIAEEVRPNE